MLKNVVIKLSGEALSEGITNAIGKPYNDDVINKIIHDILSIKKLGVKVSLVVGGGNIWRGRAANKDINRARADHMGMLGTVINGIYLSEMIKSKGGNAVVMTPIVIGTFTEQYEIYKAKQYLENDTIVIFSAGAGLPYLSTDTITSIRAAEMEADAILFAKNINGIYSNDPRTNSTAIKYDKVTYEEILTKNLNAIDLSCIAICQEQNLTGIVFGLNEDGAIIKAVTFEDKFDCGTIIKNKF